MGWEEYNQNVFIERKDDLGQEVLPQVYAWANLLTVEKNVWTIVAPPGMGKTWLLRAAWENWTSSTGSDPAYPDRLVIWINAPDWINRSEEYDTRRMFNLTEALKRLKPFVEKARVTPFDRDMDPSATIDALVAALCEQRHLNCPPIVIVDGYDELTQTQAGVVSERVLERFVSRACVHMLIARRADFPLQGYALKNPHVIRLQAIESVADQFTNFANAYYSTAAHLHLDNLETFKRLRPYYQWDHPYINAFLFDRALSRPSTPFDQLVTQKDIEQCCQSLVNRPNGKTGLLRQQRLVSNEFDCLKQIAQQLAKQWTSLELETQLGFKLHDAQVAGLFKRGLIFNVKPTQRYQVADGLRELLREL